MRQIAVVVEGQTEQAFLTQVVAPHLGPDVHVQPIITHTSRAANGKAFRGGGGWAGYERHLRGLLAQPHWDLVTTMIDFYAYPSDAPGHTCHATVHGHRQDDCVRAREAALTDALRVPRADRWQPFVMLHEFETLVIAAGSRQASVLGDTTLPSKFREMITACGGAERINDSPETAPSKRVMATMTDYRKPRDGVAIVAATPLAEVAAECPRFADWLAVLRA